MPSPSTAPAADFAAARSSTLLGSIPPSTLLSTTSASTSTTVSTTATAPTSTATKKSSSPENKDNRVCADCEAIQTVQWRRIDGVWFCNACGCARKRKEVKARRDTSLLATETSVSTHNSSAVPTLFPPGASHLHSNLAQELHLRQPQQPQLQHDQLQQPQLQQPQLQHQQLQHEQLQQQRLQRQQLQQQQLQQQQLQQQGLHQQHLQQQQLQYQQLQQQQLQQQQLQQQQLQQQQLRQQQLRQHYLLHSRAQEQHSQQVHQDQRYIDDSLLFNPLVAPPLPPSGPTPNQVPPANSMVGSDLFAEITPTSASAVVAAPASGQHPESGFLAMALSASSNTTSSAMDRAVAAARRSPLPPNRSNTSSFASTSNSAAFLPNVSHTAMPYQPASRAVAVSQVLPCASEGDIHMPPPVPAANRLDIAAQARRQKRNARQHVPHEDISSNGSASKRSSRKQHKQRKPKRAASIASDTFAPTVFNSQSQLSWAANSDSAMYTPQAPTSLMQASVMPPFIAPSNGGQFYHSSVFPGDDFTPLRSVSAPAGPANADEWVLLYRQTFGIEECQKQLQAMVNVASTAPMLTREAVSYFQAPEPHRFSMAAAVPSDENSALSPSLGSPQVVLPAPGSGQGVAPQARANLFAPVFVHS